MGGESQRSKLLRKENMNTSNSIVIIGSYSESNPKQLGTGFWAYRKGHFYLLTCEHIFVDNDFDNLFYVPFAKAQFTENNLQLISLPKPIFHPLSTKNETYDVAVFDLPQIDNKFININSILPADLENAQYASQLKIGSSLKASGYPNSYIKTESSLAIDSDEPLVPWVVFGKYQGKTKNPNNIQGNSKKYFETFQMKRDSYTYDLSGISGGSVSVDSKGDITGICIATNQFFIDFVDIKRAIEIIEKI